jgi:hypothetical protein
LHLPQQSLQVVAGDYLIGSSCKAKSAQKGFHELDWWKCR